MSVESGINIFCAVASLAATIIVAFMQIKQSNRMEKFEKSQNDIEEKRYQEDVHAKAVAFLSKYYDQRGLIPLCAIARMYSDTYYYDREMYAEFMQYSLDVQKEILNLSQFDIQIDENIKLYNVCLEKLEGSIKQQYPQETKNIFYDNGKYLERGLKRYGRLQIPEMPYAGNKPYLYDFIDYVTETLSDHSQEKPITKICTVYDFTDEDEEVTCYIALAVAKYTAIFYKTNTAEGTEDTRNFGSPGAWAGETIDTMEDMFLSTLFEMYVTYLA